MWACFTSASGGVCARFSFLPLFQRVHLPKRWKCWQKYMWSCVLRSYPEGKLSVDVRVCLEETGPSMRESVREKRNTPYSESHFKHVLVFISARFVTLWQECEIIELSALWCLRTCRQIDTRITLITLTERNEGNCFALEKACHACQVKTIRA